MIRGFSRQTNQRIAFALLALSTVVVVAPVVLVVVWTLAKGSGAIDWAFLTQAPRSAGKAGGIFPAIVGTTYLMIGTLIFSLPVGVAAGIYLAEYAPRNWLTRVVEMAIINLAGVPSIVYGLFGLGVFVLALDMGMSLLSASLTLACQAMSLTITTARESILAVPREHSEGSLAIGVTKWQTVRHIVLPEAWPGIITGTVLAMSRAAGETAPILVVGAAFLLPRLPQSPLDQFMALPYHLYTLSAHVPGASKQLVWGVTLVLLAVVLSFDILATVIRLRARRRRF